jgi:prolyl-tRNA synthetase
MRWSRYFLHTTREVPNDAEVASHRLMARSGMIRRLAAGIYIYQPLAWRVFSKLMAIVRREMDESGSIELAMPAIQPSGLWKESKRWDKYGAELLRIQDRHGRDFCFGPTHEEVITFLVRNDVKSYRQLPVSLYQIQSKFRDEIRPRFGLMRGREFLMKDAYTFHADEASLAESYEAIGQAYRNILEACGLRYSTVEADSGTIGGSESHEFMVLADTGESVIASCESCDYAANVEKARGVPPVEPASQEPVSREKVSTPGATSIAAVSELLDVPAERMVKTLLYKSDKGPVAVAIRGDQELNEIKLQNYLDAKYVRLADQDEIEAATSAPPGFAGPVGLKGDVQLLADLSVRGLDNFVCGANEADAHFVGTNWGRDAEPSQWLDLRSVKEGDGCPLCGIALRLGRGIEVGHTFMLGTVYSEPMGCTFLDANQESHAMEMGCYGFGVSRTVAATIEQNHDDDGIIWPIPLAPFQVLLMALNLKDDRVREAADELYELLVEAGLEVFYDDRDERPGVKFKDADLIGIPVRIVVGARGLAEGTVELSLRRDREKHLVAPTDVVARAVAEIGL